MKIGTKSVLFGVHQIFIHPFFVLKAWRIIYQRWPLLHEWAAIITHDLGYLGSPNMDGDEGERHPQRAADWWLRRVWLGDLRIQIATEIRGHSKYYAKYYGLSLSKLYRADKLGSALYPLWLYLLLGNLSGEIHEYMEHARNGKFANTPKYGTTQRQWLIETQAHMALQGIRKPDGKR